MTKIGALYWLFFLLAVGFFVIVGDFQGSTLFYLLFGLLIVMGGLLKLDTDRQLRRRNSGDHSTKDHGQFERHVATVKEDIDNIAKKIIALENKHNELRDHVAEKYNVRSGKKRTT